MKQSEGRATVSKDRKWHCSLRYLLSIHEVFAGSDAHFARASSSLIGGKPSLKTLGRHCNKSISQSFHLTECKQKWINCNGICLRVTVSNGNVSNTHLSAEMFSVRITVTVGKEWSKCGQSMHLLVKTDLNYSCCSEKKIAIIHTYWRNWHKPGPYCNWTLQKCCTC